MKFVVSVSNNQKNINTKNFFSQKFKKKYLSKEVNSNPFNKKFISNNPIVKNRKMFYKKN